MVFDVTVPEGTSVMRAHAEAGIAVPKLCAIDSVEAFGSCVCVCGRAEGRRGTPASCTTPVSAGMIGLRDVRYAAVTDHFEARGSLDDINSQFITKDDSNPYFAYDLVKCIVCSCCVRADHRRHGVQLSRVRWCWWR